MHPAVALRGITKRFPAVVANDGVDFEAAQGEVHALLGENGAGKTTLSNILTGLYRPDEGEIVLFGEPVEFHSPRDAIDAGVAMVHQHFRLVVPFTVAENVVLGDHRDVGRTFLLHQRAIERRVERALEPLRPRGRSARADLAALGRRAAARRDPQGAVPGRAHPHPRRADGGADAAGGRRAVRDDPRDGRGRPHDHLHLAQAARGEGGRGPRHRASTRTLGRDGRHGRGDAALARRAHGWPRDRAPRGASPQASRASLCL